MATLAAPESSTPASPPFHRRTKSWARRLERCCCTTFAYFPLSFVYGLTTWAVWVECHVAFFGGNGVWSYCKAALAVSFYTLANSSYTIAVFTNPGSPIDPRWDAAVRRREEGTGYLGLPTDEAGEFRGAKGAAPPHTGMGVTAVTAKNSTGSARFCKKCQTQKPDRAHHCSTCGRCVLKMDHHCPWLATCVGLRNYKPFVLFLVYTTLFCWTCFCVTAYWVWMTIVEDERVGDSSMALVNTILLAVLSGIIGLVLGGFTGWHIYLAVTGQTTIESLEKTRYLTPLRRNLENSLPQPQRTYLTPNNPSDPENQDQEQQQGLLDHLKETHANALPGVLRPEEGESNRATPSPTPLSNNNQHPPPTMDPSPAKSSLQNSYAHMEARREADRYNLYLDEKASEQLPNAFDLGWRRNLAHVFGERRRWWPLPVQNTSGDGWGWEVSARWTQAREGVARERAAAGVRAGGWDANGGVEVGAGAPQRDWRWMPGQGFVGAQGMGPPAGASGGAAGAAAWQMQALDRDRARSARSGDGEADYSSKSSSANGDEEGMAHHRHLGNGHAREPSRGGGMEGARNWNDIPDDFLAPRGEGHGSRSQSRGRRKGD